MAATSEETGAGRSREEPAISPASAEGTGASPGTQQRSSAERRALVLGGVAALLPFALLLLSRLSYVPIWDGRLYFDCIVEAAHSGAGVWGSNCFGHPTMAFVGLHALLQRLAPSSYSAVIALDLLLGALGLWALADVWRWLRTGTDEAARSGDASGRAGAGLVWESWAVALVAFSYPAVAASAVQVNPDYGVFVFFLLALRAIVRERWWQAALWGLCCSFSKEVGVVLYLLALGLFLVTVVRAQGGRLLGLWPLLRAPQLLLPPLLLFAFLLVRKRLLPDAGYWADTGTQKELLQGAFFFGLDPVTRAYLAAMGVLSFAWVPLLLALAGGLAAAGRRLRGGRTEAGGPERLARVRALFAVLLWLLVTFLLTRVRTYLNVRYFLACYPLLVVVGALGLAQLVRRRAVRLALLGGLALLFLASNERTLDPLSRRLWGTIPFGRHELLRMTSITGECCGPGRDQLVYNLEFTHLASLQDQLYRALRPGPGRAVGLADRAEWFTVGPLDPATGERRAQAAGADTPRVITTPELARVGPVTPRVLYLDLPGYPRELELPFWYRHYELADVISAEEDGYQLNGLDLERKPPR